METAPLEFNINCTKGIVTSASGEGAALASLAPKYNGDKINRMYLMSAGDIAWWV